MKLKFSNLKLSHRLFLIIVIFFLLPYMLLYFYSYKKAEIIIKDKLNQITYTNLEQVGNLIENQCINITNASEYLISMDNYKSLYYKPQNQYKFLDLYQKTDTLVQNVNNSLLNGTSVISILAGNQPLYSTVPLSGLDTQAFFNTAVPDNHATIENSIYFSNPHPSYISSLPKEQYISCVRRVSDFFQEETDLYLVISTPISIFLNNLDTTFGSLVLMDASNHLIADSGEKLQPALVSTLQSSLTNTKEHDTDKTYSISINDSGFLANCLNLKTYNWKLISIVDTSALYKDIYLLRFIVGVISLILILICVSVTFYFIYHQLKPLTALKERMEMISKGNWNVEDVNFTAPDLNSKDEISILTNTFYTMIDNIHQLIKQKQEAQKRENELHFEMLLAQINPHFLFNTLNSIKWMSIVAHTDNITTTITSLGRLLEISMNKMNDRILIEDEIMNIKSYSQIQQIRYPGRFEINYSIDDSILKLYTLKLVLQPIVENSIIHNIENREFLTITISGQCINNTVILKVHDNGVGINKKSIENILSKNKEQKNNNVFRGIGVSNVHERIQLEYGADYGLHYESDEKSFTDAFITFPKITTLSDVSTPL